jgi:hypothetical protein
MAGETVSGGQTDSMFFSNWVGSSILDEARPHNVVTPLFNREGRRPGLVFNFPLQDDPGAAASNQTEGTAFANTQLTTSSITATARLNGVVATVTDVLDAISITDAVSHFAQVMGRSVAEEREVTSAAAFSSSSGTFLATLAGFYDAMGDLEAADATGAFVAVFTPAHLQAIRALVSTSTGAFQGRDNLNIADIMEAQPSGYVGNLAQVACFLTSAAATSCMFVKGVTFGLYEIWETKTETHRDIFQPGTQLAATSLYGVCTVRAAWATKV